MSQKEIIFVTGNTNKLTIANAVGNPLGIAFTQRELDIDEIQSEDAEKIVRDKAAKAYELVQKPLVVNDDTWIIPGLNGFPGPYMKSMVHWLSTDDFLRLVQPLNDRRIILRQCTVYQDGDEQELFQRDIEGVLLAEPKGDFAEASLMPLVSFDEGKTSVAEHFAKGWPAIDQRQTSWHDFCEWLTKENV